MHARMPAVQSHQLQNPPSPADLVVGVEEGPAAEAPAVRANTHRQRAACADQVDPLASQQGHRGSLHVKHLAQQAQR